MKFNKSFLFLFFISLFFISCQTYTDENSGMRYNLYSGQYNLALNSLEKSNVATEDQNYVLYRMEKGMLYYLLGQYQNATTPWLEASRKLDDLYTLSLSKTAASFVLNDTISDYEGELHERVLLPIFSAISFYANHDLNNAQVMIRKSYDVINNLQSENAGKNSFKYDNFAHYFSGFVYESNKDWDNAIVEYKSALNNFGKIELSNQNEKNAAENEILKSLGRLGTFRHRPDILAQVKALNPKLQWTPQEKYLENGEVLIIYESGIGPVKIPVDILLNTGRASTARVSFPEYRNIRYNSHFSDVYINQKLIQKTIEMENIGNMARQSLNDRRARDLAKMTARVLAKGITAKKLEENSPLAGIAASIFNVATETADTRSWTSLPDTLQIARVFVPPNKETNIEIQLETGEVKRFSVYLKAGEKTLIRFRTVN